MKSSPLNELSSQDIKRKQKKLMKIQEKLSDTDMNSRKQKRLKERKHKTIYQIATKDRGRPTSLKNKEWLAGEHQMGEKNLSKKSALNMLGVQPKSPLNQNDSIASVKAWDKFKSGYMNRTTHPATGKPIDSTYNQKEYDMEKNEFYYDTNKSKMRLIPTDDGEVQDEDFKSKLKKWQLPPQK